VQSQQGRLELINYSPKSRSMIHLFLLTPIFAAIAIITAGVLYPLMLMSAITQKSKPSHEEPAPGRGVYKDYRQQIKTQEAR
jgi:hypothetical protein